MATRRTSAPRKRANKTANTAAGDLLAALDFMALAYDSKSTNNAHHHVRMQGGEMMASNGVLAVGMPIQEQASLAPHAETLHKAIKQCKSTITLAQQPNDTLLVQSGAFKTSVPCAPMTGVYPILADAPVATITADVLDALRAVVPITDESSPKISGSAVLLQSGSAVATDGMSLVEYWHGCDLPPNLLIPKKSVQLILKSPFVLTKLGFSANSVTFHADNGAWIKSQLYTADYPNYVRLFEKETSPTPLPEGLADALAALKDFCGESGRLRLLDGIIASTINNTEYQIVGLQAATNNVNIDRLAAIVSLATRWDTQSHGNHAFYLFGDKIRAAIAVMRA